MENQILCDNPRIILHPLAGEFLSRFGTYVLNGKLFRTDSRLTYFDKTFNSLRPRLLSNGKCSVSHSTINTSYFLDTISGECIPMYLEVRCGKCDNCKKSRVSSLVHRCKLESMSYKCQPIFLTLTYNEENKPKDGVNLRDVQLFFKRLRINLQRNGYASRIRYLLVAEYGKNTSRPHYHAILWNLHQSDMVSYRQIGEIIEKSWHLGFEMHRLIDMRNDKAFFYTSKYLCKDCVVPEGCNKTFMVSSNRGGAIGALFLASLAPDLRKTLNPHPKFYNHFKGCVEDLQMCKYVLDKIFPSSCKRITSVVRTSVKRFVLNYAALHTYENDMSLYRNQSNYDISLDSIVSYFSRFMYIYRPDTLPLNYMNSYDQIIREMDEDLIIIERFMQQEGIYFDPLELDNLRHVYLHRFFESVPSVNISKRGSDFRRSVEYLSQFEIL